MDRVQQYAENVVAGRVVTGRPVRLACERHLRDLDEGHKRGLVWDWESAEEVIQFFAEVLILIAGSEGEPFTLAPSQVFIVGSLFGWKGPDGHRRFRVGYIEQGKGSGKSPLAAGMGLYMLVADGESRAEVYSAAVDREQATVLFKHAVAMVDQNPDLAELIIQGGGHGRVYNLAYKDSWFRPITSERKGRGKSGPLVHCALLDEVHEHPTSAMVEFMRAGTKSRDQALILMLTNSGSDRASVCFHYHEYALRILAQQEDNDAFFGYVCSLDSCSSCYEEGYWGPNDNCDECDDWKDETVWPKPNPLLEITPGLKYLREQVTEAIGLPSKQSDVRRLNMCEWMAAEQHWMSPEIWRLNGGKLRELQGRSCFAGLDLSGKNDLSALVLIFPWEDGTKDVLPFFWTPLDDLRERQDRDRTPYTDWVRDGYLIAKPGLTIDYGWIAQQIAELTRDYRIEALAYDPYRIEDLKRELLDIGVSINLVSFGQGTKYIHPALEGLEDDLKEVRIRHANHPVLTSCAAHTRTYTMPSGERRFDKDRATGRIDGTVAMAMGNRVSAMQVVQEQSCYDLEAEVAI